MTEQNRRLEKALRGCAERGVPDVADPWPAIKERVTGEQMSEEPASAGHDNTERATSRTRRRSWLPQFVPNTPLGWTLAVLSVLVLGTGAFAASGPVGELFRRGLPGSVAPGSERGAGQDPGARPDEQPSALRTEVDQTESADGARLTLDWAYADEKFVVVGLDTQRLDDPRTSELLEPSLVDDTTGDEGEFPPFVKITDGSGRDFDTIDGGTALGPRLTAAEVVFDVPGGLEPGRTHRFRLEVPLLTQKPDNLWKPAAGPFVFDFEVPVRPAHTVEVGQKVEAGGVAMTLERVTDPSVLAEAIICYEPPDDKHTWLPPLSNFEGLLSKGRKLGDGCWSFAKYDAVEGRTSLTVKKLEGLPTGPADPDQNSVKPKTIRGPWTFEFKAPKR